MAGKHTFGFILDEAVDLRDGTIEGNDGEAMVGDIHDQVLAHNGQTNEAKISTRFRLRRCTDIDAGQPCASSQYQISVVFRWHDEGVECVEGEAGHERKTAA
jgi:hypothetical protein